MRETDKYFGKISKIPLNYLWRKVYNVKTAEDLLRRMIS